MTTLPFLVDRSKYQEEPVDSTRNLYRVRLDVPKLAAAGCIGVIHRLGVGVDLDPTFHEAVSRSIAAHHPWGFYHVFRSDGSLPPTTQVAFIMAALSPVLSQRPLLGAWTDLEAGSERGGSLFFSRLQLYLLDVDSQLALTTGVYSRASYLDFYFTLSQQKQLAHRPGWWANPYIPLGWKTASETWAMRQRLEPETVPGVFRVVDVDDLNLDSRLARTLGVPHPMTEPIIPTGCQIGGHTQGNSSITDIYRDLAQAGAVPNIGISDEDGGKMLEWQAIGVPARIARYEHGPVGDDHDFEGGGSGRRSWSAEKRQRWVTGVVDQPYIRSGSFAQFQATTHFQIWNNEWENQDVAGWLDDLDLWQQVLEQSQQRSVHDKAVLMGISDEQAAQLHPVRYVLPIFNYGTPKTWEMYQAIADHPIWPKAAALGWVLAGHEGIGPDQPFDYLADGGPNDQGVRSRNVLPGAPYLPGAGLVNFRLDYLLYLLWQKGIKINWAVLEWYDGRFGRDNQVDERVTNLILHDQMLAKAGGPWRAYCLGYCTFELTNDPNSPWYKQDFTLIWRHPRWRNYFISQAHRFNGGIRMPDISQPDFDSMVANNIKVLAAAQADQAILARYAGPAWKAGDIAFAITDPFNLYGSATGGVVAQRHNYQTTVQHVLAVSADGTRLKVFDNPEYWVLVKDVRHG